MVKKKTAAARRKAARRAGPGRRKKSAARAKSQASRQGRWAGRARLAALALLLLSFLGGLFVSRWVLELDRVVVERFEGRTFAVPSRVFSAPLIVYPGADWQRLELADWLLRLGYREQPEGGAIEPGRYVWSPGRLRVHLRAFDHPARPEPARELIFELAQGQVVGIVEAQTGQLTDVVVLEPEPVSAFLGRDREQRDLVEIEELPPHLVDAIFAVEDQRFTAHHGVDLRRVLGAVWANLRAGRITQGASTLTQQLVKNFFLTPERTFSRKLQEACMALIVEARYSKTEILQAYLNEIYLGQRGATAVHGVGEASRLYFGKSAAELTVAEAALIAAIIQSPNGISPHRRPERAVARRDLVLGLMRDQGRISNRAYQAALAEPLRLATIQSETGEVRYFLDALSQQLPEVYAGEVLTSEGLRIYSTLDPRLQRAAARALRRGLERIEASVPEASRPKGPLQGCLIALRPQTGEVLALVGGREYGASQFNRCTQARRQVGSVFKPFVYVAALDRKTGPVVTLASFIQDEPFEVEVPGEDQVWRPENYDHIFRGPVSVREALERSLNVPAARLGERVGMERVVELARRLGIRSPLPAVPSLALGTAEISPLELARAYATLANGGRRPAPRMFVDGVEINGMAQESRPLAASVAVLDPATAYLGVSLLEGVVDRGTARRIRSAGLKGPIAAKTGTTDDEFDLWFVGFTPELVAVVWVGYDERGRVGMPSARGALPIWADFLKQAAGTEVRGRFAKPRGIVRVDVDPSSGALALPGCPERKTELFLEGTEPVETCPPSKERSGSESGFRRTLRRLFGGDSPEEADEHNE
ncbi:PBP1A family penicillin-binding protein [Myxococcota bacterium]|nr:PBP1A family penicillin-binding protein [Myxococcota bacterium]